MRKIVEVFWRVVLSFGLYRFCSYILPISAFLRENIHTPFGALQARTG